MGLLISKVHRLWRDMCSLKLEQSQNSLESSTRFTKGHATEAPLLKLSELVGVFKPAQAFCLQARTGHAYKVSSLGTVPCESPRVIPAVASPLPLES